MAWINGEEVTDRELFVASSYEDFYESLPGRKLLSYWQNAEYKTVQPSYEHPVVTVDEYGVLGVEPGLICPRSTLKGVKCTNQAGRWTDHEGVGQCARHGGTRGLGKSQGAILMAMAFADELNVTPWEALLSQVRLLANQVQWLRLRVQWAEAEHGIDAIKPGGEAWDWVVMLEARGDRLAKVSKMAIDAGIAERFVSQLNLEAEHMVTAAIATFERLGIHGDQREEALEFMGNKLMELEAGSMS